MFKPRFKNSIFIPTILLIVGIISVFVAGFFINKNRVANNASSYIEAITENNSKVLQAMLQRSEDRIVSSSMHMSHLLDDGFSHQAAIKKLEHFTAFEKLLFVDLDGFALDSQGKTYDMRKSIGYILGRRGHHGMGQSVLKMKTSENRIFFYAPIHLKGSIKGIIFGYFSDKLLHSFLDMDIFGYPSKSFILTTDGTIVASNIVVNHAQDYLEFLRNNNVNDNDLENKIVQSLQKRQSLSFSYESVNGSGQAHLTYMPNAGVVLVQSVPSSVIDLLVAKVNREWLILVGVLLGFIGLYIGVLFYFNLKQRYQLADARRQEFLHQTFLKGLSQSNENELLINLQEDSFISFKNSSFSDNLNVRRWSDAIDVLKPYFEQNSYEDFSKQFSLSYLKDSLSTEHPTIMLDARMLFNDNKKNWKRYVATLANVDDDGKPLYAVFVVQDITEENARMSRINNSLKEAYQTAKNANAAKTDFLSKMSHDIRTPMNAIIGMTAIASTNIHDSDRVNYCLTKINESSQLLISLINEVLDMSRIESGTYVLNYENFNLSDLIQNTFDMIRPMLSEKNHHLEVNIENLEHENVIGDKMRLQQVFLNLLTNAIKYTNSGGNISLNIKESQSNKKHTGCYEFVFKDNGIGMTEEFQKRVFLPFERAEDSRTSKIQGTGLGMAIVYNIVQMMGGHIELKSKLNQGSTFTVQVFLRYQNLDEHLSEQLRDMNVLVVDNEINVCDATCLMLNSVGMRAVSAYSGESAIDIIREKAHTQDAYKVAIVDWKMPHIDGIETVRKIREIMGQEILIIIISAYDWEEVEQEAKAAGVDYFLSKPLFKSKLIGTLSSIISNQSSLDHSRHLIDRLHSIKLDDARILLVEDNEVNREIASEIIRMTGATVEIAENGRIAVEKIMKLPPNYYNMILMDIQMPEMNGYEATRYLRQSQRKDLHSIPIIAMTANAFAEDILQAKQAGMNEHLSKPVNFKQFSEVMKTWINKDRENLFLD